MRTNSSQWFLGMSAVTMICLIGLILNPSMVYAGVFSVISTLTVANSITFLIAFSILRKLRTLAFWRFAVYLIPIVAAGMTLSGLTTKLSRNLRFARDGFYVLRPDVRPDPQLFLLICGFVLLASLNFVLWRVLYNATLRQALLLGFLVGFFNTITYLAVTPVLK